MKNWLIYCIAALFPKRKGDPNRILVISTTGVGDTLWATPALAALKKGNPNSHISFLTRPIGKEVLKYNPNIDQFFLTNDRPFSSLPKLIFQLRRERFSKVIIFHASQRPLFLLASCLGAKEVIGTVGLTKGLNSLLTKSVPDWGHEIDRRLAIATEAGGVATGNPLSFHFSKDEELPPLPEKPYLVFQPGAHDKFKRWPIESFISLGKKMCNGYTIYISGSPSEKKTR